jgi:hypothetical protein
MHATLALTEAGIECGQALVLWFAGILDSYFDTAACYAMVLLQQELDAADTSQ